MKMKNLLLILFSVILFSSCVPKQEKNEGVVKPDPKGALNIDIRTSHMENADILTIIKTVHNEKGEITKTITSVDTIPQMSMVRDTLSTGKTYINKDGDKVEKDTIVVHPKDYVLYISVKKQ